MVWEKKDGIKKGGVGKKWDKERWCGKEKDDPAGKIGGLSVLIEFRNPRKLL